MARDWASVFDVDDPADLFEHFERDSYRGREYRYLPDERHGVERGTVIVDGVVIRGYPSIPRVLALDPGVPEFFDGPVAVEEKLNGYNARVADVPSTDADDANASDDGSGPIAFTRSGHACRYTTDLIARRCDLTGFFEAHPEAVLCGEVIGPENPYTTHDYAEVDSAGFRAFGVRDRESGEPLSVERRREVCGRFGIPQVPHFGTYDPEAAVEGIREAIGELDERGREGVVVTATDGRRKLKYTTSAIHRSDLEHAFALPFEYGREFVFSRVLREVFQAVDREESDEAVRERARALGESILLPAVETVRAVERGETIGEEHVVRGDAETVEALLDQFRGQGLRLQIRRDERAPAGDSDEHAENDREGGGDERVVEFVKIAESTRDKAQYYLDGGTVDE